MNKLIALVLLLATLTACGEVSEENIVASPIYPDVPLLENNCLKLTVKAVDTVSSGEGVEANLSLSNICESSQTINLEPTQTNNLALLNEDKELIWELYNRTDPRPSLPPEIKTFASGDVVEYDLAWSGLDGNGSAVSAGSYFLVGIINTIAVDEPGQPYRVIQDSLPLTVTP